jgi:hypothetical protein
MLRSFQRATGRAVVALSFMLGSLIWVVPALADEPLFGYAYTADLLPKGKWELEQWITDREGQAFGHYHNFKFRTEVEYGLTDNFQLSGYLNYSYLNAKNNSVVHLTEGLDIPFDHDSTKQYSAMRFDGISGGDLRVKGPAIEQVRLRPTAAPGRPAAVVGLANGSLASSSGGMGERCDPERLPGLHVHGARRHRMGSRTFVCVIADRCVIADALTKVVLGTQNRGAAILRQYGATAHVYTARSGWHTVGAAA